MTPYYLDFQRVAPSSPSWLSSPSGTQYSRENGDDSALRYSGPSSDLRSVHRSFSSSSPFSVSGAFSPCLLAGTRVSRPPFCRALRGRLEIACGMPLLFSRQRPQSVRSGLWVSCDEPLVREALSRDRIHEAIKPQRGVASNIALVQSRPVLRWIAHNGHIGLE
jgi:hypothetical protein